jgi:hypothetical protein
VLAAGEHRTIDDLEPDQIQKLLSADLANIVRKLGAGKTLTTRERALLEERRKGKADDAPKWVKGFRGLAEALPYSREAFRQWAKLPGAPRARPDNMQDAGAWRRFIEEKGLGMSNSATEQLPRREAEIVRRYEIQNERAELDLAIRRREYVTRAEVVEKVSFAWTEATRILRSRLVDGAKTEEERARNEVAIRLAFQELHEIAHGYR